MVSVCGGGTCVASGPKPPRKAHARHAAKYCPGFRVSQATTCFVRCVLLVTETAASLMPPACVGVTSSPGFTLWWLLSIVVACVHRNCLYLLCSSFSTHRGNSKTIAVNNMEGRTMELSGTTRFSTLIAPHVAVRSRL